MPTDETEFGDTQAVIRGTFSGEWAKDTYKDVDFTTDNGDSKTKAASLESVAISPVESRVMVPRLISPLLTQVVGWNDNN